VPERVLLCRAIGATDKKILPVLLRDTNFHIDSGTDPINENPALITLDFATLKFGPIREA